MGDTAVDIFLETLNQLLTSSNLNFIIQEKLQLQSLKEEIKYLRKFLMITEKKRDEHSEVLKLVMRIRDVVSEAENIVELFIVLVFKTNHSLGEHQDLPSLDLESIKKEIKILKAEVKKILDENMYDINGVAATKLEHSSTESGGSGSLGVRNTSIVETKVVVGFKEEVKTLIQMLRKTSYDGELEIISITGIVGAGKTTLAREVYDHPFTLNRFGIRAWVNVSQDYDSTRKRDLLIHILESISLEKHEDLKEISDDKLGKKIYKCLRNRKFLIVMDDIWSVEAWHDIERVLPTKCKSSKVMFTSRLSIRPNGICFVPHCLNLLSKSHSWELLEKKVFGKKCCPPELVDIGKEIAEKCGGLALAIVSAAGILAMQVQTLKVWQEVAKDLILTIVQDCMKILELSYNHLPPHLKVCFLYIGAFPEDYEIPRRELIWLWIAEGFIHQSEGQKTLEDIAEDYLKDLIERNLVMVARKSKSYRILRTCRIHHLFRVLCWKKAADDDFFVQIYEDAYFAPSATNKHRRLFISRQFFDKFFFLRPYPQNLRSFMCLGSQQYSRIDLYISFFVEAFKLLRVFNFIGDEFRGEILRGNLVHLRYLALQLSRNADFAFPSHLFNLETLTIQTSSSKDIKLPSDIFKMVKLRHLYTKQGIFTYHFPYEEAMSFGFDKSSMLMNSLQTLNRICGCNECQNFLERTPNLRKLGICVLKVSEDGVLMLPNLELCKCLEKLSLTYVPNHHLSEIATTLPPRLMFPPTVTQLTLKNTCLKWEELSILHTLPSLQVLILLNSCRGRVWDTSELKKGFSRLRLLRIRSEDIEEWNATNDQFPSLVDLVLEGCRKLKAIPSDFLDITTLRAITLTECSPSAEKSARFIRECQLYIEKGLEDDCVCINLLDASGNRIDSSGCDSDVEEAEEEEDEDEYYKNEDEDMYYEDEDEEDEEDLSST